MTPLLRWVLLPFLLFFSLSAVIFAARVVGRAAGWDTSVFSIDLQPVLGFPGRLIDVVQFVNSVVIFTLLVLAIPLWFVLRDFRASLRRYAGDASETLHLEKDQHYVAAARRIFATDPAVAAFFYGHTHTPSLRQIDGRYVINTGTWLKRLEYVPVRLGHLPGVYLPSYQLNWFELSEDEGDLRIRYVVLDKKPPNDLTWLERLLILGRRTKALAPIPAETRIPPRSVDRPTPSL